MYETSDRLYNSMAEALIAAIGGREFFAGQVVATDGEVECRLTTTLIIEHCNRAPCDGEERHIAAIRPVWWECATRIGEEELLNDFSLRELIELILPNHEQPREKKRAKTERHETRA